MEAADRPGLLVDLVKIITDINIAVESGEFDTEVTAISLFSTDYLKGVMETVNEKKQRPTYKFLLFHFN